MIHWLPFILLACVLLLVQTTVGGVLVFTVKGVGGVGPDLLAILATFAALWARNWEEVMLAAWGMGFALDLTSSGGMEGGTALGPMSLGYAAAAGLVFRIREAFFRDKPLPQAFFAMIFCILAHGVYLSLQSLLAYHQTSWSQYGRRLLQAGLLAIYTGLLMVPGHWLLAKAQRWLVASPVGRAGRL